MASHLRPRLVGKVTLLFGGAEHIGSCGSLIRDTLVRRKQSHAMPSLILELDMMPSMEPVNLHGKEITPLGVAAPVMTNVDRRGMKRTVPMKVLCLGMGRTGTSSLRIALIQLGYVDCYHMLSVVNENPKDTDLWVEAYDAKYGGKGKPWTTAQEWDQLLGHCMAVTDSPCADFAEELIAAYPDAKVILTVRDTPEQWHASVLNTLYKSQPFFGVPKNLWQWLCQNIMPLPSSWHTMHCVFKYRSLNNHPEKGLQAHLEHNEEVRRLAKVYERDFLEFNVKEGWGPLCEFLGVEAPGYMFPRVNDTETFTKFVKQQKMEALTDLVSGLGRVMIGLGTLGISIYIAMRKKDR